MKRSAVILGLLAAAAVLFWFLPLFNIVPRNQLQSARQQQTAFNAAEFAKEFWTAKLLPSFDTAADATAVLAALRENPQQARSQFGRSVGVGRASIYFIHGSGSIISVDKQSIGVSSAGPGNEPDLALLTGLLFGNTVRDATGLLDASDFPNSQHFNDLSTALNHLVEANVIPRLKEHAEVGRRIDFVGCAEVLNVPRDIHPLRVIPLEVNIE